MNRRGSVSAFAGNPEATDDFAKAIQLGLFDQWLNAHSVGMAFAFLTSDRLEGRWRWRARAYGKSALWGAAHR
jgi:hypothetical protein